MNYGMMSDEMLEATRLTREGQLAEATALIQRTLAGASASTGTMRPTVFAEPIAVRDVVEPPPATESPVRGGLRALLGARARRPAEAAATRAGQAPTGHRVPPRSRDRLRPGQPPVAPAPGRWIADTHTGAAGTRTYKLYVPSSYHGAAVPLVVMLHGGTQTADDFAAGTGMNFQAEAGGFLVVYPEQAVVANQSRCWNWFQAADQQRDQGEPALIAGITRQVMGEYRVEASRVFVAGLSAGGAMAAIVAAAYPELYAAVGVHSGLAPGSAHDLPSAFQAMHHGGPVGHTSVGRAIPLIVFHGDRDKTVHPSNADQLVEQWVTAAKAGDPPRETTQEGRAAGGRPFRRTLIQGACGNTLVERWTIHGGGHAWSGGRPGASYTDPKGPDASAEMVRFFREHSQA